MRERRERRLMNVRVLFAREKRNVLGYLLNCRSIGGQGRNRTADAGLFRAAYRIAEVASVVALGD